MVCPQERHEEVGLHRDGTAVIGRTFRAIVFFDANFAEKHISPRLSLLVKKGKMYKVGKGEWMPACQAIRANMPREQS
jgi:hypothetical protein